MGGGAYLLDGARLGLPLLLELPRQPHRARLRRRMGRLQAGHLHKARMEWARWWVDVTMMGTGSGGWGLVGTYLPLKGLSSTHLGIKLLAGFL
jgi:hypothetical protein